MCLKFPREALIQQKSDILPTTPPPPPPVPPHVIQARCARTEVTQMYSCPPPPTDATATNSVHKM